MGLERRDVLSKVPSVEGPVSRAKPTFDGPVDAGICIDGYGDCRPTPAVRGFPSNGRSYPVSGHCAAKLLKQRDRTRVDLSFI